MAGSEIRHLSPAMGEALEQLGFSPDEAMVRDVAPATARGTNVVVATPPAAVHLLPALAGAVARVAGAEAGLLLVLAHEATHPQWAAILEHLAGRGGAGFHRARSTAQTARVLRDDAPRVLLAAPDQALALVRRSALNTEQVLTLVLAWPELWESDDELSSLMPDLPEATARLICTTDATRVAALVDRYARRAFTLAPPASTVPHRVRTVLTPWALRRDALERALALLDPSRVAAWSRTGTSPLAPALPPGLPLLDEASRPELVVAWDIPETDQLARWSEGGEVLLLVPPEADAWVRRMVPRADPVHLPGSLEEAAARLGRRRDQVEATITGASLEGAMLALAPLFDRHDPVRVAAALYRLWQEKLPEPTAAPPAEVLDAATARVWVGVGKKDGAVPGDFMALLTRDAGLERERIGKIEIRELYSLVEVPAAEAEALVRVLNGQTIRRRRVTARVDRGRKTSVRR